MYHQIKAEYYGDISTSAEIGLLQEPVMMKRKAKNITLPNGEKIKENRDIDLQIMKRVLRAKFRNKEMEKLLLETGTKTLIELNEYDSFFGVGLSLKSQNFDDKKNWKGKNNLGLLLMELRSERQKTS